MNRLSMQEIILGFFSTIILTIKLGWLGIALSAITAVLWVLGGSFKKSIRRIGVPLAVSLFTGVWWSMLGFAVLTIGDGYPDSFSGDEGSWLGKQVKKLGLSDKVGGLVTKVIPVILLQLFWIPVFL